MRINQFLARAGVAARRKADELVRAGRVRINGHIRREVGITIQPGVDRVTVDGRLVEVPPETLVVAFHKPAGCLVSRRSQGGKPTIFSLLPPEIQTLQTVGRLDFDTSGLLLLTNDGELSRRLQHPRYQVERVYRATVAAVPEREKTKLARSGVDLGDRTPARAAIRVLNRRQGEIAVEVKIREGRKHEVKRLLAWAGAPVLQLVRISFAGITVTGLPPGACRKLRKEELAVLRESVGLL